MEQFETGIATCVQWRSQDELVTWAHGMGTQHEHTQCVCNTHLLGGLGHAPAMNSNNNKKIKSYIHFCTRDSLYVCVIKLCTTTHACTSQFPLMSYFEL